MQKIFLQKNNIQAASLYSEKSLLAQWILSIDRLAIELLLPSDFIVIKFLSSKTWFKISLEVTLEIFERYLRARLWIENPFALDRWGQKFFKLKKTLILRKLKTNKNATNSCFL